MYKELEFFLLRRVKKDVEKFLLVKVCDYLLSRCKYFLLFILRRVGDGWIYLLILYFLILDGVNFTSRDVIYIKIVL